MSVVDDTATSSKPESGVVTPAERAEIGDRVTRFSEQIFGDLLR
jgi:hypothetical protein